MESQIIPLLTSIASMIIAILTVLGIIAKYSDKILYKAALKAFESVKITDLDPRSEIYQALVQPTKLAEVVDELKRRDKLQESELKKISYSVNSIEENMKESKGERFKADLRSRLEYVIMKKGKVDKVYWEHAAEDFTYYSNVLKMNTYMGSLYKEAEQLYIKSNIKREHK